METRENSISKVFRNLKFYVTERKNFLNALMAFSPCWLGRLEGVIEWSLAMHGTILS